MMMNITIETEKLSENPVIICTMLLVKAVIARVIACPATPAKKAGVAALWTFSLNNSSGLTVR